MRREPGQAPRWQVRRFPELDSTNTWLLEQARRGAPEGVVVVADHQTAGRGRLGRRWESPPGSALLCSILLRPSLVSSLVVAAVSLAGRDAVRDLTGGRIEPALKWPNDLVVDEAKLAGVLAEVEGDSVVVGMGINITWAPPGGATMGSVERDDLLAALLDGVARWYTAPAHDVASAYRRACATLGRTVRVELTDETFAGVAVDVDDEGALLVDVGVCIRTVTAGDVVHVR